MICTSRRAYRASLGAILVTALWAPSAFGGGFATVGVTSPDPKASPGAPWNAVIDIRQHGRTPLSGVKPKITISRGGAGEQRTFAATPTGEPGRYRASVVFPSPGRWTYTVDDGFSMRHEFPAVTVTGKGAATAAAPTTSDDGRDPWLAFGAALVAGLLAAALTLVLGRRRAGGAPAAVGG